MSSLKPELVSDPAATVTRIVATMGPATFENIEGIIKYGTIRCNLAFVKTEKDVKDRVANIKRIRENSGNKICMMLDAVGPRVKLAPLPDPLGGIPLTTGEKFIFTSDCDNKKTEGKTICSHFPLHKFVKKGEKILLAEGKFVCRVEGVNGLDVEATVIEGGQLKKRGINLPDSDLGGLPALSDEDKSTISAVVSQCDVDQIALSFVRTADDVKLLREFLASIGKPEIKIMSKIETQRAVDEIYSVASVSDALMVARGDLWCELRDSWSLPIVTCNIIQAGQAYGIPVITATQVCSSMATQPLPSRAEVDELYFLLKEGSDCVMGSEEFGIGKYPAETAAAFRKVGELVYTSRIENSLAQFKKRLSEAPQPKLAPSGSKDSVGTDHFQRISAIEWAEQSPRVQCIVVISSHGKGARCIYRHHPSKPLVVVTNDPKTARYMQQFQVYVVFSSYTDNVTPYQEIADAALGVLPPQLRQNASGDKTALVLSHHKQKDAKASLFHVEEFLLK